MLGDVGANVIKVEWSEGNPFRRSPGDAYRPTFVAGKRNKRRIVLDLKTERDRTIWLDLNDNATVSWDNFRPSVLSKLNLAPDRQ